MSGTTETANQLRHEVLVGGISNTIFNGIIAWLLLKGGSTLTYAGEHNFSGDVVATTFILPFIVALIVIPLNQRKLRAGKICHIDPAVMPSLQLLLRKLPSGLFLRAVCFGVAGMLLFTPLILVPLWLLGVTEFQPLHYAVFKGLWAGVLAATLVVPMVLIALQKS